MDDDQAMCELVATTLKRRGLDIEWTTSGNSALEILGSKPFDVLVTDVKMRDIDGLELCNRSHALYPELPVIVITGFGSMESAVGAIRAGAHDYLTKPFQMDELLVRVQQAARQSALTREVKRLRERITIEDDGEGADLGQSPAMRKLAALIERAAPTEMSILIVGESGTGKELVAREIHRRSDHSKGRFVAVNCAALPPNLLESELFGHVKGAFTDARQARSGLFVEACGGTLFLDEITELPLEMQPKLLRALQERKVRPVGGNQELDFDTRILAATNRDLEDEIRAGRFRDDLFYRLNVIRVDVPPLRKRREDILSLAQRFLLQAAARCGKEVTGITPIAAERLLAYDWPGNVRELENYIERAVVLTEHEQLLAADFPHSLLEAQPVGTSEPYAMPAQPIPLAELEKRYIMKVLRDAGGNKSAAARLLGFDRRTLYRKLERYEI